jgi:archaellum component FlaC
MTELDELRTEISGLREVVRMADSDTMETKDLLKHQTQLMMALREVQNGTNMTLGRQGEALGGMVIAINDLQGRVSGLDGRVLDLSVTVENEMAGVKGRLEGVEGRLEGVEGRLEGIGENITAIMRHLRI